MKTCKHCGTELVIRQTQKKPSQLTKQYYYTAYYFCPKCRRIYHDDTFKMTNQTLPLTLTLSHKERGKTIHDGVLSPAEKVDVEIWTDGACAHNGTPKAKAAWAFVSGKHEEAGMVEGTQTNNRGEAFAILYALQWAAKKKYKRIIIYTDSQISIYGVTKHFSKVKVNQEIFRAIANVISENTLQVTFKKVLGHSGDENNERVDRLANGLASA